MFDLQWFPFSWLKYRLNVTSSKFINVFGTGCLDIIIINGIHKETLTEQNLNGYVTTYQPFPTRAFEKVVLKLEST